jgi:hypothetical protein
MRRLNPLQIFNPIPPDFDLDANKQYLLLLTGLPKSWISHCISRSSNDHDIKLNEILKQRRLNFIKFIKVKLSLKQAVEAHRVVRRRGSNIF